MGRLTERAKKLIAVDYMKINDIIAKYDGKISINGVTYRTDQNTGELKPCFTFSTSEGIRCFYITNVLVLELYRAWLDECDNDFEKLNNELREENVNIKLSKTQGKRGNTYVSVEILDV